MPPGCPGALRELLRSGRRPGPGLPFVVLRRGNDTRDRFDRLCAEGKIKPAIAMEVDQLSTAYHIAGSGIGAALVSDTLIQKMPVQEEKLRFYPIASELTRRPLFFHYPKNRYKKLAAERFIEEAIEFF